MDMLKINRAMIPCKIMYLLFGGITGTFSPYLHVFLESLGFKSDHAGFLTGIRFVLSSLANPVWGFIADRTGHRKLVLFVLCAGSAVLVFPQPWIARSLKHDVVKNQSHAFSITLHPTNRFGRPLSDVQSGYNDRLYYVMLVISSLSAVFMIPLPGYLNTIAVNVINGPTGQGATYGGQRIFGDVGFSIANYLAGMASDHYVYPGMSQYTPVFYMVLVFIVLTVPIGCYLIKTSEKDAKKHENENIEKEPGERKTPETMPKDINGTSVEKSRKRESSGTESVRNESTKNGHALCNADLNEKGIISRNKKRDLTTDDIQTDTTKSSKSRDDRKNIGVRSVLWEMMKNPDIIFFLCTVIISGVAWNTYNFFTLLLINHVTPNTKAKMSLALVLGSVSNIIFFPLSSHLIKLLGGPSQGIIVGLLSYFVRYMVMAYTNIFEVMITIQLLHGLCFALSWSAMIEHTQKIAPQEIVLTVFMLLSSIHFGICGLIANIVGGTVFDVYGGRALFGAVAMLCAIWAVIMAGYCCIKFINKRNLTDDTEEEKKPPFDAKMPMEEKSSDPVARVLSNPGPSNDSKGLENMEMKVNGFDSAIGIGNKGYCYDVQSYDVRLNSGSAS